MKLKNFLSGVLLAKSVAGLLFGAFIIVYSLILLLIGKTSISIAVIWQALGVIAAGVALQSIFFTMWVFKSMRYLKRLTLFVVTFLPVSLVLAAVFGWIQINQMYQVVTFVILFFVIFFVLLGVFSIYFKLMGQKYTQLLEGYQRSLKGE